MRSKNRTTVVRVRTTPAEKYAWEAAAQLAGLSLSDWIRTKCGGGGIGNDQPMVIPPEDSRLDDDDDAE